MSSPTESRGAKGRAAFRDSFRSEEERRTHMRQIGARGNAGRLTLSGDERAALFEAYDLLRRIAARHGLNQSDLMADAAGNGGTK